MMPPAEGARRPTVQGEAVTEMAVLIQPPAYLITFDGGTHDLSRAFFQDGKYTVAHSTDRAGPYRLTDMALDEGSLRLTFEGTPGRFVVLVPSNRVQSTHRV